MNRTIIIAIGVAAVALLGAGFWMSQGPSVSEIPSLDQEPTQVQADGEAPEVLEMIMGAEDAPITVVEYASFTCPHCRSFHKNAFGDLKTNYIDTGKVKFVYREVYFDKFGLWAGMVARCAGPDRYFGVTDLIYEKQAEWLASRDDATIADELRKIGLSAGMDPDQLEACLTDGDKAQAMVATYQANREADDVRSTPTFIIDGETFSNMSYTDFAAVLEEKLTN